MQSRETDPCVQGTVILAAERRSSESCSQRARCYVSLFRQSMFSKLPDFTET